MAEFKIVQQPKFSPTVCTTCGTHVGPFVDTEVDLLGHGHLYLCVGNESTPGCLAQMARLAGFAEPWDKTRLDQQVADLELALAASHDELREIAKKKSITVEQALALFPVATPEEVRDRRPNAYSDIYG